MINNTCIIVSNMKFVKSKKRMIVVPILSLLSSVMCFSIGFSAWSSPDVYVMGGSFDADTVNPNPLTLPVIEISSLTPFQYTDNRGFVSDGEYVSDGVLQGTCTFDYKNAKKCFDSFTDDTDKSFKLSIALTTNLSGGFSGSGLSSDSITLSSTNFNCENGVLELVPNSSADITSTTQIVCLNNSSNFSFSFSISLKFDDDSNIGNEVDLSAFPTLSDKVIVVSFTPLENKNV